MAIRQRFALGADVDLLAPVGLAAREFEAGAIVAAEMRRVDHLDRELVALRQREESPRERFDLLNQVGIDAVAS